MCRLYALCELSPIMTAEHMYVGGNTKGVTTNLFAKDNNDILVT